MKAKESVNVIKIIAMSKIIRQKAWLVLKSRNLAIYLIVVMTVAATLGVVIPQANDSSADYGIWAAKYPYLDVLVQVLALNRVFSSWWFLLISGLFLANLSACTWEQGVKAWRIWQNRRLIIPKNQRQLEIPLKDTRENTEQDIARRGFRIINKSGEVTVFEKGAAGIWGTTLVHIGLIIIIVGALISAGFKMTGYMTIMEGELRQEAEDNYEALTKGPFFDLLGHRGYNIGLKQQERILDETGRVKDLLSHVAIFDANNLIRTHPVEIGKPLIHKGLGIYEYNAGFAPLMVIAGSDGDDLYRGFLFMETIPGSPRATYQRTAFVVPGTPFMVDMEFFPDLIVRGGKITTRQSALGQPGMDVLVTKEGRVIGQGVITGGEALDFAGFSLSFDEVRHWAGLEITYDPGANVLFAGFLIGCLGLALLYLRHYRKLQVRFEAGANGLLAATACFSLKYQKAFIEEIDDLMDNLAAENHQGTCGTRSQ